ncbi:hypothetical protein [Crassaminicella profunda]|uniref:hypothetical protein n=1 Tax=Crassaminicella profunda TaxID=1286698 RepID=UPI001CA6505D|nr:hypothetical protein [Crassaminicella profunda]QZY53939.1 hypothetical protein K7H06_12845 [Crassaminicella profunda]
MKKKILFILLCFTTMLTIMLTTAYADIGPKPSIVINFEGLEDESYYVTLLSEVSSTGPHRVLGEYSNNQRYHEGDEEYTIWQKFLSYEDKDGFYFLQYFENCTHTSEFTWGYYPPPKFKILIYFPEQDSFVVSEDSYEQYAFDSYYKVDAKGLEIQSVAISDTIKAEKNYDYTWEIVSLFGRIILTIAIEVLIALFFCFKAKKQLLIIGVVNIITQSILNILLNIINYYQGSMMFVFNYVWMELLVLIIEAVVYSVFLHKYSSGELRKKWLVPLYALTANAVSFGVGLYIAHLIPGIF